MKDDLELALKKLGRAVARLREGIAAASDDLDRDGVIQRFEFTFELFWKALRLVLEQEGICCTTPRECLKAAFRLGLIEDEQPALDMLAARNRMSHTYSEDDARQIFNEIGDRYFPLVERVAKRLLGNAQPAGNG